MPSIAGSAGLIQDVPADQEVLYITRKDQPWQHHFNGGISAAFLAKLYMATGEAVWLDLARQYQDFSMTTDACQFESMQTCKSGWGAGLLYYITREERYRDWTVRMGDWFQGLQCDDGHWDNTKHWTPNPTPGRRDSRDRRVRHACRAYHCQSLCVRPPGGTQAANH